MGTLDELVAKDAEYRAKVAACAHDFSGRSMYGDGPVCTKCAVLELAWLRGEVSRVRALINRDRTGLAKAIDDMVHEATGRLWITEGRGAYEWDDEEYRRETGHALRAVIEIGKKALNDSGKRADSAFHPDRSLSSDLVHAAEYGGPLPKCE
jgi:hypothetical protein